jgi:hypothetical protein
MFSERKIWRVTKPSDTKIKETKMKKILYCTILTAGIICVAPMICVALPPPPAPTPPSTIPEPQSILAGALLLVPLAAGIARAFRKPRE